MTQKDYRAVVQRYMLHRGADPTAPAGYQHYAYYAELPGCVAQADSREAALAELDELIQHFVETALPSGATLPVPLVERVRSHYLRIGPIIVGDPADLATQPVEARDTNLELAPTIERRAMQDLVVA